MSRQAKPLDPTALSAFHDCCIEEIHQAKERRGLLCLLGIHTGLRKRIIAHYTDDWRVSSSGETDEKFSFPKGTIACTIEEDGCAHCDRDQYSGDDGFFGVKKNTSGGGREVPVWEEWMDYHQGEYRDTQLPKWLDHFFAANDSVGYTVDHLSEIIKRVATRRFDTITEQHEGEDEQWIGSVKKTIPDIKTHDLRASWAQQCLRVGVDDEQLMDWAGWSTRGMVDRYRSELNDPSGENTKKYARGREGERDGMSPQDKLNKLRDMGMIDEGQNLSADELAEMMDILG